MTRHSVRVAAAVTIGALTGTLVLALYGAASTSRAIAPLAVRIARPSITAPVISPMWWIAYECGDDVCTVHADGHDWRRVLKDANQPVWSPDHKQLAFAREGNVWISDADGGHQQQITFWPAVRRTPETEEPIRGISWNPRYHVLSFGRIETVTVTLSDGTAHRLECTTLYNAALTPNHRRYAAGTRFPFAVPPNQSDDVLDERIADRIPPRYDLFEGRTLYHFGDNAYPAWNPAGDCLALARNGEVWIGPRQSDGTGDSLLVWWNVRRAVANADYDGETVGGSRWTVAAVDLQWAPDGSFLVYDNTRRGGSGQDDIHMVRPRRVPDDDRGSKTVYEDRILPVGPGQHPSISPDGKWILLCGWNGGRHALMATTLDGKVTRTLVRDAWNGAW